MNISFVAVYGSRGHFRKVNGRNNNMLWALRLRRGNKTTSDFTQPRTKLEQGGGTVEISPFLFFSGRECTPKILHCHVSVWRENAEQSLKTDPAEEPTEEFACHGHIRAKMAFATTSGVHESFCHIVLSLSARLTLRLLSFLSSSVPRPHPSLVGRVHYANDPAGAVSTRRTLRYHFPPPGLFFSPIAHTESWPNSIPLT